MSWRSSSLEISARLPPDLARLEQRDRSLSLHVVQKMTEHADSMMLFQWVRFSSLGEGPMRRTSKRSTTRPEPIRRYAVDAPPPKVAIRAAVEVEPISGNGLSLGNFGCPEGFSLRQMLRGAIDHAG